MAAKNLKVKRTFTYKAYVLEAGEVFNSEAHTGQYLKKSECHYYVEKDVLDLLQQTGDEGFAYGIYQVSTIEDDERPDKLVEIIRVKDGEIFIDYRA